MTADLSGGAVVPAAPRGTGASATALLALTGAVAVSALVSARFAPAPTNPTRWLDYKLLRKPSYTPPDPAFALWGPLYAAIIASGYAVWRGTPGPARDRALAHWLGIQVLNPLSLWLGFGARLRGAAALETVATAGNAAAYVDAARRVSPVGAILAVPYAAWVAFVALLTEELWRRNDGRR